MIEMQADESYIISCLRKDDRHEHIVRFHFAYRERIIETKGSKHKHQAWKGGYLTHLRQTMQIATDLFDLLNVYYTLPFNLSSAYVVLYFHDIEALWKYVPPKYDVNKPFIYLEVLKTYGIEFTEEEMNALTYIHGEPEEEYNDKTRIMWELATFCHCCDIISARIWHDKR